MNRFRMFLQWQRLFSLLGFLVFLDLLFRADVPFEVEKVYNRWNTYVEVYSLWYFGSFEILLHGEMPGERGR